MQSDTAGFDADAFQIERTEGALVYLEQIDEDEPPSEVVSAGRQNGHDRTEDYVGKAES